MNQYVEYVVAWMQTKFGVELFGETEEGQGLVEYALILVLISIASVIAMGTLSAKITTVFGQITTAL